MSGIIVEWVAVPHRSPTRPISSIELVDAVTHFAIRGDLIAMVTRQWDKGWGYTHEGMNICNPKKDLQVEVKELGNGREQDSRISCITSKTRGVKNEIYSPTLPNVE